MANTNTQIKFSSVQSAVDEIVRLRTSMETDLIEFENTIRTMIERRQLVGKAADTFEASFGELKKTKFEPYVALVQNFIDTISKASQATESTASALDRDAENILFK